MNTERIKELAEQAGDDWSHTLESDKEFLEKFAALVAAEEREACAKVCDDRVTAYQYATDVWAQEHIDEARHLAKAIRARGNE